jgi:3-oxoacyl-[acyl-carrier-protein] synthase II
MAGMKKRVAVTGLGAVTPLGNDIETTWAALLEGRSGAGPLTAFPAQDFPVTFGCEVRGFEPERWVEPKDVKKLDRFLQFAIAAARMAADDAKLEVDENNADDVAIYIGSGVGGLESTVEAHDNLREKGPRWMSAFTIPKILINLASGHVSLAFGARGPNLSHVSACATGNHSIGEALRVLQYGDAKVAIAGSSEAAIVPLAVGGFAKMRAMSTRNDDPQRASRPFDKDRDGFVIGEGAGVLILEEWEHARARGARIYCELVGYGANSDAYHMTAPSPDGSGASRCMDRALRDAGWAPGNVDYINAHGTSTPLNDVIETIAIKRTFGEHARRLMVSSTKSMTGHLLGAAGGVEAAFTVLSIARGLVPPTINLVHPDPECDLDYVPNTARRARVRRALSNGFGFGGTNATLAFAAVE